MQIIPDLALPMYWAPPNGSSIESLKTLLDNKLRSLFDDRRDILFAIRMGFTRGVFYNQDCIKIDDSLVEEIPTFDALPAHHNLDPIARLMEKWGKQWEQKAWKVTRPDIPAPVSIREMLPYPNRVYEVTRKGVPYKVRKTAKKVCHHSYPLHYRLEPATRHPWSVTWRTWASTASTPS